MDAVQQTASREAEFASRGVASKIGWAMTGWLSTAAQGYGIALGSTAGAFLLRWWCDSWLGDWLPCGFFLVPVVLSAWRGGLGPCLAATLLGLGLSVWFFVEPRQSFYLSHLAAWISVGTYVFTAGVICWAAVHLRRANRTLRQAVAAAKSHQEELVREIEERKRLEQALALHQQDLEHRVQERTAEVEALRRKLHEENLYLREKARSENRYERMVGQSEALQHVLAQMEQVAPTDSTVLLLGETGTGKELLATTIHNLSPRRKQPLVSVNCAAMPAALVESELFGRERGAFTGSLSRQVGRFELADGSTIFLDEIGELSPEVQVKLLRVLEARQVERLGNPKPVPVNVRVIAATNRNLEQAVREGRFRQDLYYRLNVFPITVPPLRDRREDIPLLVWAFVDEFSRTFSRNIESIDRDSMEALQRYSWPGNIRELRNLVERAMILASGPKLRLQLSANPTLAEPANNRKLEEVERDHILGVLETCGWRVRGPRGAAVQLGLKPTTLEARMARLGIRRPGGSPEA